MKMHSTATDDLLEEPCYRLNEAASYLAMPTATLRCWVRGQLLGSRKPQKPIIELSLTDPPMLSFMNLLEAHVVNAFRRRRVPLQRIRVGIAYLKQQFPSRYPLLDNELFAYNRRVLLKRFFSLIELNQSGQLAMEEVFGRYLERIERTASGVPLRLYPFTRKTQTDGPKTVMIDPRVAFGRPVLVQAGIPVEEIVARFDAGDTINDLAVDYGRTSEEIEEAIRFYGTHYQEAA